MKLTFSITLLSTLGYASAFTTPSANLSIKKDLPSPSRSELVVSVAAAVSTSTTKLFMAEEKDEEDDGPISDELSALIGKRASLTKKTNEPRSTPSAKDLANEDYIDPNVDTASYDGKTGMDIYDMPDFKAGRPLKSPKVEDKKRSGGAEQKDDSGGEYVDFQAEYDDENDFHIPNRIGFTTKAWGDESAGFKAGKKLKKKEIKSGKYLAGDLQVAFDKLMENGITFVDTSENFGVASRAKSLSAEQILCQCLDTNMDASPIVASTMSNPWRSIKQGTGLRFGGSAITKAIEGSGDRLGTSGIDLYQVPSNMFYVGAPGTVAKSLCAAMDQGLINNIGVKNMSKSRMKNFNSKLNKIGGYTLTSNQFEFSLVNRKAWKSGLITACKSLGIVPVASNPLGDGLASGVFSAADPTGGQLGQKSGSQPFDFKTLEKYSTLHDMITTVRGKVQKRLEKENSKLKDRRDRYGGQSINTEITTTQIAINYIIAKGCVPMPSVKNPKEADEIIGCIGWSLSDDEVKMLDNAADMSDKGVVV